MPEHILGLFETVTPLIFVLHKRNFLENSSEFFHDPKLVDAVEGKRIP